MEKRAGRVQKKTLTFISEVVGSGDNLDPILLSGEGWK
jgi:hypothetical protein